MKSAGGEAAAAFLGVSHFGGLGERDAHDFFAADAADVVGNADGVGIDDGLTEGL